jgi:hypothetical protein
MDKQMYINRKTGERVEAKKGVRLWTVITSSGYKMYFSDKDFQEQYGEAMICPNYKTCKTECTRITLHIKNDFCSSVSDCGTFCIPYIHEEQKPADNKLQEPKEYDVDDESTFPICGTCNAQKDEPDVVKQIAKAIYDNVMVASTATGIELKFVDKAVEEILSIINQAGYVQLQADDKGLVNICQIVCGTDGCPSMHNLGICTVFSVEQLEEINKLLKAQKALGDSNNRDSKSYDASVIDGLVKDCDGLRQEKEEAVKKVKLHLYKIRDFLCPEIKTKQYAIDSIDELLEELK